MIFIRYNRRKHRVTVTGHAGAGMVGQDIVCAGVSAIAYTVAAFAENLRASDQAYATTIRMEEGDARIESRVYRCYDDAVRLVYDAICGGFELIARQYPERVDYRRKDD